MPSDGQTAQPELSGQGLLHMLPIPLKAGMQVEATVAALLPWASPSLLGLVGRAASGEPLLIIGYEWPIPWARVTTSLTKRELEWVQLERFRTDYVFALHALPFGQVSDGLDPPDFVAATESGPQGFECTSFVIPERREALNLFGRIRAALVGRPQTDLNHLRGFIIYLWFGPPGAIDRPFRRSDDQAADELVRALLEYRPDPDRMKVAAPPFPERAPDPGAVTTASGASFYAIPLTLAAPGTMLFALQGFELGLAFSTEHTAEHAWEELARLIAGHDRPGVDWLLISVGAPNRLGQASEAARHARASEASNPSFVEQR